MPIQKSTSTKILGKKRPGRPPIVKLELPEDEDGSFEYGD
jgi:hypothetical protein